MATSTMTAPSHGKEGLWAGGGKPMGSRYGKLMMWFFLLSDAFTFSGLLISYGMLRFKENIWPNPEKVFSAFPGVVDHGAPLVFVGLMTFILIMSSVTMVLAVDAGHKRQNDKVVLYLFLTILGGAAFLGCQAMEWTHMIVKEGVTLDKNPFGPTFNPDTHTLDWNSPKVFAQLFFTITGFHGAHVTSGVIMLIILFNNVAKGMYARTGDYEMVEKIGLYWHFVDLVWVFVFTLFYLI